MTFDEIPATRFERGQMMDLETFCALSVAQATTLALVGMGVNPRINPATRLVICPGLVVVDEDGLKSELTERGLELLDRAVKALDGQAPGIDYSLHLGSTLRMVVKRNCEVYPWLRPVHVKALATVGRQPMMAKGYLVKIFGGKPVEELLEHELVEALDVEADRWAPVVITARGRGAVEQD